MFGLWFGGVLLGFSAGTLIGWVFGRVHLYHELKRVGSIIDYNGDT